MQILPVGCSCLFTFITVVFSCHFAAYVDGEILPGQRLLGDVAINCGCLSSSTALDGRPWAGETPLLQPSGKSRTSTSTNRLLSADPTPYLTARISSIHFSYTFQVSPGQKFLRFHFSPALYQGFENSQDFFTVKANSFTLLQNFSASLAANALGVTYIVKEFCLNVNEKGILQISFFASQATSKSSNFHAFVNGIELISMPTGLYYTHHDNLGARVIGQSNRFYYVDNGTALELVQRLNVGGGAISPLEDDTCMFRRWVEDTDYVLESGIQETNHLVPGMEYTIMPHFIAPLKIYQTSRKFRKNLQLEEKRLFTWKIPVDLGFNYLLRLHFCYFKIESLESSVKDFNILVQYQVNEITLSGGNGIPVYKDYLVMMKGDKAEGKCDLFVSLQPIHDLDVGLLKGIEIFKLSNPDNSLASPNPSFAKHASSFWALKIQNFLVAFGKLNAIMTIFTIISAIVNAAVYKLRQIHEYKFLQEEGVKLAADEPSCQRFSLAEILSATHNFNDALVIGKGGFGKVYKGFIHGCPEILAIKRLKPDSKQGAHEFWREVETLSKLRHIHLVSLIGYCNENGEMILVYEYMPRGTVADNLYKAGRNTKEGIHLTWDQRLRICIGAARGLDYLHTGTRYGVIHRDVKDTNILLDENFVTKISDFGLSKLGTVGETQDQHSTKVKGTIGYLDPDYLMTHKPSIKSDVYAFGIVLLVVLSGRPAVETKVFGETHSLLACFRECMTKGEMNDIIDPNLQGEIATESLAKFLEAVVNCLHHHPKKRPTMAQVVVHLEHALDKQQLPEHSGLGDQTVVAQPCQARSNQPFEFYELQVAPIPEKSIIPPPEEGNDVKDCQNADLRTTLEMLRLRIKDCDASHKPLWGRPWEALRTSTSSTKKQDLALGTPHLFSLKDIKLATKNFSKKLIIGKGSYGKLYKGSIHGVSGIVAIRRFSSYSMLGAEEFWTEVGLLSVLHYIHLVSLVGFCNERGELITVHEYMSRGELGNHLYQNRENQKNDVSLSWEQRLRICLGVARGLNYLHNIGVIHRHVHVGNIMLDENFVPKISDLGLSKLLNLDQPETHISTRVVGTHGYIDPHYAITGELTKASDVYSFGIILLMVLSGSQVVNYLWPELRFEKENVDQIIDQKLKGIIPLASLGKLANLTKNCLLKDPKLRPAMSDVVSSLEAALNLALEEPNL